MTDILIVEDTHVGRRMLQAALSRCDLADLTVVEVDRSEAAFTVHLIPETLRVTTFGEKVEGAHLNVEIERRTQVIVDTVRAFLEEQGIDSLRPTG